MRDQYKVLAEKYNQVTESLYSSGPSTDYSSNKTVNETIVITKQIIDKLYNANSYDEVVDAAKDVSTFLLKHAGKIVPRETPGKPFSSYGGPAVFQSALDLFDILINKNIKEKTAESLTKPLTTLYSECYKMGVLIANEQAKNTSRVHSIPWVSHSGSEEDVKRALKNWLDIKVAAPMLQKGSEEAGVNLDI